MLRAYTRLVRWSVAHHYKTVALGLAIFAGSIGSFYLLPSGFLPAEDTGRTLLAVELPPGSRMDETKAVTDAIARQIRARPDVKSVFVNGGKVHGRRRRGAQGHARHQSGAQGQAQAEPGRRSRPRSAATWRRCPTSASGSCRTTASASSQLVVSGRDAAAVTHAAAELTSQAKRIPLIANVVSTAELDRPELRVVPITDVAAELGVSTEAISEAVRIATIGDIGANLAKFDVGDRQVPIRVQLEEQRARRPADARRR